MTTESQDQAEVAARESAAECAEPIELSTIKSPIVIDTDTGQVALPLSMKDDPRKCYLAVKAARRALEPLFQTLSVEVQRMNEADEAERRRKRDNPDEEPPSIPERSEEAWRSERDAGAPPASGANNYF